LLDLNQAESMADWLLSQASRFEYRA